MVGLDPFFWILPAAQRSLLGHQFLLSLFMLALLASSPHQAAILVLDGRTLLEISSAG